MVKFSELNEELQQNNIFLVNTEGKKNPNELKALGKIISKFKYNKKLTVEITQVSGTLVSDDNGKVPIMGDLTIHFSDASRIQCGFGKSDKYGMPGTVGFTYILGSERERFPVKWSEMTTEQILQACLDKAREFGSK